MLELWIIAGVVVWLGLMTIVLALCASSARADRASVKPMRREPRIVRAAPRRAPDPRLTT